MNFEHMPELKWTYGYYFVVGAIGAVCTLLTCVSATMAGCKRAV